MITLLTIPTFSAILAILANAIVLIGLLGRFIF
ncbi:hypothetical protein GGR35_000169 [Mucilaginibacter phyllosphaerae]|uniref:Uncharacterized protein n=1 Tax=Mucilaginibacter phyllosphaerae TaxID=1812349 RepID=A0ABR6I3H6_9SPHI|nr:hypothetical protein [Mucilaginibacter phyllosphaerae]